MRGLAVFGRAFVALNFILLGVSALWYWELSKSDFTRAIGILEFHAGYMQYIGDTVGQISSNAILILAIGVCLQLIGGLFLFIGYHTRFAAFLLLVYQVPAALIYHHFWFFEGVDMKRAMTHFLADLAIIGALLLILSMSRGRGAKQMTPRRIKEVPFDSDD